MSTPLLLVSVAGFLYMVGLSVIFPVMPTFSRSLDFSDTQAGLLLSSFPAASFAMASVWGRISERRGRRLPILIGLLGLSVSFLWLGLVSSFPALLAGRIVGGLLASAALPAIFAYAADSSSSEARGRAMAVLGASIGVGVLVGVTAGGLLGGISPRVPFFATAGLGVLSFFAVLLRLPESLTAERRAEVARHRAELAGRGLTTARIMWGLSPFLAYSFLFQVSRSALEVTIGFLLLDRFAIGTAGAGMLLGVGTLVAVGVQGAAARTLRSRSTERAALLIGTALVALSVGAVGGINAWAGMLTAGAVYGLGGGLVEPAFRAELSRVGSLVQGEAQGLTTSAQSLARTVAFYLFPWCYQALGAPVVYGLAALICAAAFFTARLGLRAAASELQDRASLAVESA